MLPGSTSKLVTPSNEKKQQQQPHCYIHNVVFLFHQLELGSRDEPLRAASAQGVPQACQIGKDHCGVEFLLFC